MTKIPCDICGRTYPADYYGEGPRTWHACRRCTRPEPLAEPVECSICENKPTVRAYALLYGEAGTKTHGTMVLTHFVTENKLLGRKVFSVCTDCLHYDREGAPAAMIGCLAVLGLAFVVFAAHWFSKGFEDLFGFAMISMFFVALGLGIWMGGRPKEGLEPGEARARAELLGWNRFRRELETSVPKGRLAVWGADGKRID